LTCLRTDGTNLTRLSAYGLTFIEPNCAPSRHLSLRLFLYSPLPPFTSPLLFSSLPLPQIDIHQIVTPIVHSSSLLVLPVRYSTRPIPPIHQPSSHFIRPRLTTVLVNTSQSSRNVNHLLAILKVDVLVHNHLNFLLSFRLSPDTKSSSSATLKLRVHLAHFQLTLFLLPLPFAAQSSTFSKPVEPTHYSPFRSQFHSTLPHTRSVLSSHIAAFRRRGRLPPSTQGSRSNITHLAALPSSFLAPPKRIGSLNRLPLRSPNLSHTSLRFSMY